MDAIDRWDEEIQHWGSGGITMSYSPLKLYLSMKRKSEAEHYHWEMSNYNAKKVTLMT